MNKTEREQVLYDCWKAYNESHKWVAQEIKRQAMNMKDLSDVVTEEKLYSSSLQFNAIVLAMENLIKVADNYINQLENLVSVLDKKTIRYWMKRIKEKFNG